MTIFRFPAKSRPRTVWWPVHVDVPVDGGTTERQSFEVQFRALGIERAQVLGAEGDLALLDAAVTGWRLQDECGNDVPFSSGALAMLIDDAAVRRALIQAVFAAESGRVEKNAG